ncbi:MAG: hydroxyacid dehydrogenase [Fibrobacteria bacterium]|nr:hydroxyacid dehydrogenase [Fibrobacteria bacterium]
MKPKVAISCRIHPEVLHALEVRFELEANREEGPWGPHRLREACRDAWGLMAFMTDRIDDTFLDACPGLRVVAACLRGGDNIDEAGCRKRGIAVHRSEDLLTEPTAELAVSLLLGLARGVMSGDRWVRSGGFSGWKPVLYGKTLARSRVGVVGMGKIGCAVARMLRGLGARPVGIESDPVVRAKVDGMGMDCHADLPEGMDMVILALPLGRGTFHWFDASRIERLAPGCLVVNVGRGGTVDETSVSRALAAGVIGGWATDVYEFEDLSLPERPSAVPRDWIDSERTLLTPHLGSAVDSVRYAIEWEAARRLLDALSRREDAERNSILSL